MRAERKKSQRDTLTGKRRPLTSEANRRRYQNPVYLAQAQERMRKLKSPGRPLGSYDGIRKAEREAINTAAKAYATETIKIMTAKGIITPEDDPRAEEALEAALTTMRTPANQQTKLAAAKLILEYTKAKPASKSEVTVNKAEEWLAAISEGPDAGETDGDAEAPAE